MPDIYHRPIAFTERESHDPITGAPGILRREWRIIPVNYSNPAHIGIARDRNPTLILEQRYIRRGTIEPWEIFDAYDSETEALSHIDPKAIAIDCPALVWVQHDRKRIAREREEERRTEQQKKAEREETLRLRGLAIDAWWKLYNNPKYRPLCDEWNEFSSRPSAQALGSRLSLDTEFMRLYNLAHRGAITATSKRKAMRACLDYYNFMWKHRESPAISNSDSQETDS